MKIFHPTDFSRTAERARQIALDLVRRTGGELQIAHVQQRFESARPYLLTLDTLNDPLRQRFEEARRDEAEHLRQRLAALTTESGGGSWQLLWGDPVPEILEGAEGSDLIVMGAHGDDPIDRLLGGVAGRVVRRSPIPVLTVRDGSGRTSFGRLLVATDFGDASDHAWAFGLRLALDGVELVLAHVIDDPRWTDEGDAVSKAETALETLSDGKAARLVLREGDPIDLLPEIADEVGADAIALGVRHHSAAVGLLLGSRADALLRRSPVPVLSVPSPFE